MPKHFRRQSFYFSSKTKIDDCEFNEQDSLKSWSTLTENKSRLRT